MKETTRTTRECTFAELDPRLSAAIRAHGAQYHLDDLESNILMCCETASASQKDGFFGSAENSLSAVFITPKWLVWVESVNHRAAETNSALLTHIDIHDYAKSAMGTIAPDTGMNITGRYTNAVKTGQSFIGIGEGEAGMKFRQVIHDAMDKVETR